MRTFQTSLLAGLAAASLIAGPLAAQPAPRAPVVATTQHAGKFNGQTVKYRAIVGEDFVTVGGATASIVTTAYVRTDVKDAKRPVLFLFNGGPGASTTPLHFSAFGPIRRIGDGDDQRMVDNPESILDAVDLIFLDPVGTGYSRPLAGSEGKAFWSRTGDAASVKEVMLDWLKANGREASPRYMLGQSYGTTRAGMVAKVGDELNLDGILLFALVGSPEGREMPYVTTLPTFATVAWHHNKVERAGRTPQQVYDAAVEFARTDYVSALIKGASLPAAEKQAVAAKMSALIGLPAAFILEKDLRLSKDDFMRTLLKDQNLRTGMLDGRATRALDAPVQRGPYDDPGLNYEAPRPPGPAPTGELAKSKAGLSPLEAYYKERLKFRTAETYNPLNLDVNGAWDYEDRSDSNAFIGQSMQKHPKLRLFWVSGYFDITTPAYGARYALDQAGVPGDRLTAAAFNGGHSVFTDPGNLTALSDAVRKFVRPEGAPK